MDSSSQEGEAKKKITEVKTFPVRFALGEIKENITINKNTPPKPSKKQIINQAFKFHSQGNIQKAATYYEIFINQGFEDHRVFSNLGSILRDLGKLQEAEISYRKAIEINPEFAIAYSNLGNIMSDLGKLQEAEISYRKAIEINPDFADAHFNLGNIFNDLGKLQEAEISYRKVIEINPDFADAHFNLGNIFNDLGKLQDAEISYRKAIGINPEFAEAHYNLGNILRDLSKLQEAFDSYLKVIDINPTLSNIYPSITRFIKESDPSQLHKSQLKYIINLLLEKNDISHKELIRAFNFLYSNEIISSLETFDSDFSEIELLINDKVIINALKKIIFCDIKLEKILIKLRRNICHRISKDIKTINDSELQFIIALGEQCFLNEYIYSLTKDENLSLNLILNRCKNGELNEANISILSCYFPLFKLIDQIPSLKSFDSSHKTFKELMILQISEPLQEIDLSKNIKKLGKINDKISQKVKSQYEENPYPRWRYSNPFNEQKIPISLVINNEIKPNSISKDAGDTQLKVLVAGCGTGQQILQTEQYKHAQITAIDLSSSSLSYAQRKINELGIDNVELIQMDILEVSLLELKFDIIECGGVLHHMDDPSKGLKALLGVLKNNGFLKLGLYSELARQHIVEARNYIASKNLRANEDSIRDFREIVFSQKISKLNSLLNCGDFYTLSSCRDLCFHSKEHRFTIHELQETLTSNKLKFLGFLLPQSTKSLYTKYFPEDKKQTNLQNWARFEEKHPNTFKGMYQFWVSKKEN